MKKTKQSALTALWVTLITAVLVLGTDFVSKYWIQSHLPLSFQIPMFKWGGIDFYITHAVNRGAAWGMLAQFHTALLAFRIILVTGLVIYTLFYNKHSAWQWPLALIIAGAIGNIIDFFLYGHVIDMLQFTFWGYHYPVFNIADSAIFIGVLWLFILSWKKT